MPQADILTGAADPSTFSFQDNTPGAAPPPPDSAKLFNAEWDSAQQRYRAAVNSGFTEADAAQLYLDPVKNKWDILKNVPETMKRAAALDLDQAQQAFVKGTQAGYKAGDAENIYLKPAEQKWQAAASIPDESPEMKAENQKDAAGFLTTVRNGYDPTQVMQDVPEKLWKIPGFQKQWVAAASAGQKLRQEEAATEAKAKTAADAKEKIADDPEKYLEDTFKMATKFKMNVPPQIADAATKMLASRTNFPTMGSQQPVSFQPSPDAAPATASLKPKDKVTLAQKISADHPDWTKEQVIMAVQGKLRGAQ